MKLKVLDRFTVGSKTFLQIQGSNELSGRTLKDQQGNQAKIISTDFPSIYGFEHKIRTVGIDFPLQGDELELVELS